MNKILENEKSFFADLKKVVSSNSSASFLVPYRLDNYILDAAFLYPNYPSPEKTRPTYFILCDIKRKALVELRNAYINDFIDSEKYPMDTKISYRVPFAKTVAEQAKLVNNIKAAYPFIRNIAFKTDVSEEDKAKLREYANAFKKAVPEALLPFYKAASPEFYEWLEKQI
ncbi:MAG: hypothetical protein LIO44_06655 [Eubacterium sp.]|nr:hypothetical protein [Eubacterium sp.]